MSKDFDLSSSSSIAPTPQAQAERWLERQKADAGDDLLDEGDCRFCGHPAGEGHEPTDPCGIVESLLADNTAVRSALAASEAHLKDATRWLNDAGKAYAPCHEHQPDMWEGDGTCVICEGQQLSARLTASDAGRQRLIEKWRKDAISLKSHIGPLHGVGWSEALNYCADHLEAFGEAAEGAGSPLRMTAEVQEKTEP